MKVLSFTSLADENAEFTSSVDENVDFYKFGR